MSNIELNPCPRCGGEATMYLIPTDKRKIKCTVECQQCRSEITEGMAMRSCDYGFNVEEINTFIEAVAMEWRAKTAIRLTKRDEFGNADIIGVDSEKLQLHLNGKEMNLVTNALNKLADYEEAEAERSGDIAAKEYNIITTKED